MINNLSKDFHSFKSLPFTTFFTDFDFFFFSEISNELSDSLSSSDKSIFFTDFVYYLLPTYLSLFAKVIVA
jgi:hypothetical protein